MMAAGTRQLCRVLSLADLTNGHDSSEASRLYRRDIMINCNRWNRMRYTLWAPMYDRIVHFGAQRRRSIDLLELNAENAS